MMNETTDRTRDDATLRAVRDADQEAFGRLTERYRGELRVHCYRMVGSLEEAQDLVQETFLRAWRGRETFEGRAPLRAWLYGIATNACLDFLAKAENRTRATGSDPPGDGEAAPPAEVLWLQPYPDRLLEPAGARADEPEAAVVAKETIGLAFLVAVQLLPPKQRAVLILCDVLDWSANEAAKLLDLSVASVNSALQRARTTLRAHQPERRPQWKPGLDPDEQQRELLARYVSATERGDLTGLADLLSEDLRFTMPCEPGAWVGRDAVVEAWVKGGFGTQGPGAYRCLITRANGMPAVACYEREPGGSKFRPLALDVLRIEDGLVKEITTFSLPPLVTAFDLPVEL